MSAYERLFAKNSRRGLIVSIFGLLGSANVLGSHIQHFLAKSESESEILVRISFQSKRFTNKKYQSIEDFWVDHPVLPDAAHNSLSVLKDFSGRRLKAYILETGQPAYNVYYSNFTAYLNHMYYLKKNHNVQCEQISKNCFKYISQDFFAVDEIKKIS